MQEGVTTGSYAPVYYGDKQLKGTFAESVLRMFSFSPSRLSGIRDKQWSETKVRQEYTKERSNILRKYKRYYTISIKDRHPEDLLSLANEVRAYNDSTYQSKRTLMIPFINYKWLQSNLKQAFKPSKYERQRSTL